MPVFSRRAVPARRSGADGQELVRPVGAQRIGIHRVERVQLRLHSDHKERRGYEGGELYNELAQKYNIKALASTGLDIHSSIPWFVNTPVQTLFFYNYYPGSLHDHILSSMGKNEDVFPMYMEEYPAVELFELLSKYPSPSGKISTYPIRYVHSIWQEDPKSYLGMNEREVRFFRIY